MLGPQGGRHTWDGWEGRGGGRELLQSWVGCGKVDGGGEASGVGQRSLGCVVDGGVERLTSQRFWSNMSLVFFDILTHTKRCAPSPLRSSHWTVWQKVPEPRYWMTR